MHLFVAILENGRHIGFSIDQSDISHANCGACITICTIHPKYANYLLHCKSVTTYPKGSVTTCPNISLTKFVVVEKYGVFIYKVRYIHITTSRLSILTYFSSGLSHHVGSPVWLMIFLLHIALSVSSPALSSVLFKYRWHASFHLFFGRSLFLFPGISAFNTFLSMCSPSLLITCPYQINLLSVIFLEACATLVVPRMCSFLILSFRVTPHIHRSILISVTSLRFSCLFVVAHVSAPSRLSKLKSISNYMV